MYLLMNARNCNRIYLFPQCSLTSDEHSFNDIISRQLFIETNMLLILICINYRYVIPIILVSDSSPLQLLIVLPFIGAL